MANAASGGPATVSGEGIFMALFRENAVVVITGADTPGPVQSPIPTTSMCAIGPAGTACSTP